jgi:tryptophan synthase alpha chain
MSSGEAFARARAEGRAALIGYLPAGFPSYDGGVAAFRALADAGVDVIEVGVPYSDPVIDGPVNQAGMQIALENGTTVHDVLRTVEAVAATGVAAVVMSYWNPVLRYGVARFAADLASAGGHGLITPDLVPDEATDWLAASAEHDLDRIFLVAPSSSPARIASTVAACRGWVYAASTMGVTGARASTSAVAALVRRTSSGATALPVAVGLGVSNGEQAAEVASYADGVVVGSALVRCLIDADTETAGAAAVHALALDLAAGVRRPADSLAR